MAEIELRGIAHSYDRGKTYALQPMSMTWEDGKAYALLGPSGCGKTTLLNIVSGLLQPSSGQILIDGEDVTNIPTGRRKVAQVFQFPVLYETMTVRGNLDFPLKNAGMPADERRARVSETAALLGLEEHLDSKPLRLRPDLQQIVSLGRGLVRHDVAAVLFDEPLTVIDPAMKWELRGRLKQLHEETGYTLIYVTHDQTEALTFADEVIVLEDGAVMQVGTPSELFMDPVHEFVGHFIGSPGMNFLDAQIEGAAIRVDGQELARTTSMTTGPVRVGVRPEFVSIAADPHGVGAHGVGVQGAGVQGAGVQGVGVKGVVDRIDHRGGFALVHAMVGSQPVIARTSPAVAVAPDQTAFFSFDPDRTFIFADGRNAGSLSSTGARTTT